MENTNKKQKAGESLSGNKRSLKNLLDEYKLISIKLHTFADIVATSNHEDNAIALEQAKLLDKQQSLIVEARSIKLETDRDVQTLLNLWRADEIYGDSISPGQALVLNIEKYFSKKAA